MNKPRAVVGLMPPERRALDIFHELTKGAIGAIPIAGSPLASVFTLAVSAPLEAKRDEFLGSLASQVALLRQDVNGVQELVYNERFLASLLRGLNLAYETTDSEKLGKIRNSILNSALLSPGEDKRLKFFNSLQSLGPIHLAVLELFNDPYRFLEANTEYRGPKLEIEGSTTLLLSRIFSSYDEDFLKIVVVDLHVGGLIKFERDSITINSGKTHANLVTKYGKEFLSFIAPPKGT